MKKFNACFMRGATPKDDKAIKSVIFDKDLIVKDSKKVFTIDDEYIGNCIEVPYMWGLAY